MDATTLPLVKTPNRDGFVPDPRPDEGRHRNDRCARSALSIGVFAPKAAVVEDDLAARGVIVEPVSPPVEKVQQWTRRWE
jgi:hypothetical protein